MQVSARYCMLILALAGCSSDPAEPSAGTLSGVVSSAERGALAEVLVILDDGDRFSTTDEEGRYTLADVPAGEHSLSVELSHFGCSDPAPATVIQPEDAPLVHDISVQCTAFGAIRGTLTGTYWGELSNVTIVAGGAAGHVVTDVSGAFLLGEIVPGEVSLTVDGAPADCFSNPLTQSVPAGDTVTVDWSMSCRGPELRFLRQIRQGWPNSDSGAVEGIRPYLPDQTVQPVQSFVVPYLGPGYANGLEPRWRFEMAPDRSALLVSNDRDLYRVPMGGSPQLLYDEGRDHFDASYSPSGTEFIHSVMYNQGSFSVISDATGGNASELNIRHRVFKAQTYSWHPDGNRILFQTDDYDGFDYPEDPVPSPLDAHIWIMNRDGSGRAQLTAGPPRDVRPVWSPDGSEIGFLSDRGGSGFEPYIMGPDGGSQRPLPGNTYWIWASGELSPIGDKLAYAAETDLDPITGFGDSHIYIANPDGSNPQLLTTGRTGTDYSPWWVR